jgi:hypothetical protein
MNAPILSSAVCGRLLQPALQADLSTFVGFAFKAVNPNEAYHPNWHIDALCHELAKVYRGETQRLLITMPPRYLKSLCISIAFPAWAMGKDPSLKFIVASYGNVLAKQHAKDFKRVIDAPFFRSVFPPW